MTSDSGPAVQQAQLTRRLTKLRRAQDLSQAQVADDLGWSYHKMMRYETGKQVLPQTELEALLRRYGVLDTPIGDALVELGQGARQPAWWKSYRTYVSRDYLRFVGLEAGASSIHQVQMSVVPGLLQTPEYARTLTATCRPKEVVDKIVELRKERQEKIRNRAQPPNEVYIIDESVLRRHVGKGKDPKIMPRQIEYIKALTQNKNIRLHIIPQNSDWTFGMYSSFTILAFADELEDILFKESIESSSTTGDTSDVEASKSEFENLLSRYTLGKMESLKLLEGIHLSLSS
ncbi:helix-turn-helix domain-containing protein [Nocardiopsis metallicus]|uniref:Transcriptional regulator with XRE-family HTH domain n=1 Tax=Nocardiopsis metallicus TaxID=179819 RepID=A0A840WCX1_9ACTN|nr:helix-turn-helix transcriptional regulator [Nocardiopsis metallicus]MBB5493233.1 transcriptional regulator with XRE-family HTH domain [Nocardiopsis metallicus]